MPWLWGHRQQLRATQHAQRKILERTHLCTHARVYTCTARMRARSHAHNTSMQRTLATHTGTHALTARRHGLLLGTGATIRIGGGP